MSRSEGRDPDQGSPRLVREIGDQVTQIISDCFASRITQSITDPTGVADLRAAFDEPLPRGGPTPRSSWISSPSGSSPIRW